MAKVPHLGSGVGPLHHTKHVAFKHSGLGSTSSCCSAGGDVSAVPNSKHISYKGGGKWCDEDGEEGGKWSDEKDGEEGWKWRDERMGRREGNGVMRGWEEPRRGRNGGMRGWGGGREMV